MHFASTKMSLRQVLDWGFFIKNHKSEIDWTWFMQTLAEYHMVDFFHCLNSICVDDLGFDVSAFPRFQFNPTLKDRVLEDTLSPEFNGKLPSGLLKRIVFRYRRWQANAWKQDLCYRDNRFKSFLIGLWGHIMKPGMF